MCFPANYDFHSANFTRSRNAMTLAFSALVGWSWWPV